MNSLNIQSTILEIANLIGINDWQLVEGMYNGCSFTSLQPINSALAQTSIGQTINNGIFAYNSIIGALGADAGDLNGYGRLFNTTMGLMNVNDTMTNKLARKKLPYADYDNIEDMGNGGWSFTVNAIFIGTQYLTAFNNFLTASQNPSPANKNQLVHPVYGQISGLVYLSSIKTRYSSDARQAVMVELSFEAEQSNAWSQSTLNLTTIASIALTGVLGAVNAVGEALSLKSILPK